MKFKKINLFSTLTLIAILKSAPLFAEETTEEKQNNFCKVNTCIRLDQEQIAAITQHLNIKTKDLKKYELVASANKKQNIKNPTVHWYNKINPLWWFGNANNPQAPDWYKPQNPLRNFLWLTRNPLHNFTFYVVGVADKINNNEYERVGRYPKKVFAPTPGWNMASIKGSLIPLPFVSYWNPHFQFYLGWRERGNLGGKLLVTRRKVKKP